MQTSKDDQLRAIEGLTWLPWIGEKFFDQPHRVLIVGESHYEIDGNEEHNKAAKIDNYTRRVIEEDVREGYYYVPTFPNFLKAIHQEKEINPAKFWDGVAYMNIIQQPMPTNKKRPHVNEYGSGWSVITHVLRVIKPTICLFIGIEASNHMWREPTLQNHFKIENYFKYEKIGGTIPRTWSLINRDNSIINCVAIRHSGRYFNLDWGRFIQEKLGYWTATL